MFTCVRWNIGDCQLVVSCDVSEQTCAPDFRYKAWASRETPTVRITPEKSQRQARSWTGLSFRRRQAFVTPTETNVHGDALCFMVNKWARHKTTETVLNNGWRLVAVGGWWRLVAVGGWWLVAVGGGWRLVVPGRCP